MRPIPKGYSLVEDKNHILSEENDKYGYKHWGPSDYWSDMQLSDWDGKTINWVNNYYKTRGGYTICVITKAPIKPRFPTDRPYPYGW